ncbi:hypothetical protein C8Q77DRAFT_142929 [Trametes polyzona]|nr:hypothetical protein C8Q77DRAFT_142929 [Trametes polyzona]
MKTPLSPAELSTKRRLHPLKRRKLLHVEPSTGLAPAIPVAPASFKLPICTSCHRSFTGARRDQLVQCARCQSPTCTICSRTCNGCPPSMPPTPALTASPSSVPDTPLLSPKRSSSALSVNTMNTLDHASSSTVLGRRRKVRDLDQGEGLDGAENEAEGGEGHECGAGEVLPGCGRTVCRSCAFETPESDLTTCLDCAARYRGTE